ncbi:hypothetical protein PI126_g12749 [Phytophthora idaei]|nr:hypothetical protein PI126_g12749 [Phytophthora idaei]
MTCGAGYELLLCGASGTSKAMTWASRRCSGRTSSCNMTAESLAIECAAYETSRRPITSNDGRFGTFCCCTVTSQVDIVTGCALQ